MTFVAESRGVQRRIGDTAFCENRSRSASLVASCAIRIALAFALKTPA